MYNVVVHVCYTTSYIQYLMSIKCSVDSVSNKVLPNNLTNAANSSSYTTFENLEILRTRKAQYVQTPKCFYA